MHVFKLQHVLNLEVESFVCNGDGGSNDDGVCKITSPILFSW